MPYNTKPGIDWHEIEARVRAGESFRAIARDLCERGKPISHVAVAKRARKLGWVEEVNGQYQPPASAETVNLPGSQTLSQREAILSALRNGATLRLAALAAGVSDTTLRNWRHSDLSFAAEVAKARGIELSNQVQHIRRAAEKGDWRAAAHILAKSPETRAEWGEEQNKSPQIQITLNIQRAVDEATIIEGSSLIDGESEAAGSVGGDSGAAR